MRSAWLDIPSLVEAAGADRQVRCDEFVRGGIAGPDERLLAQVAAGIEAIRSRSDIQIACSLGADPGAGGAAVGYRHARLQTTT